MSLFCSCVGRLKISRDGIVKPREQFKNLYVWFMNYGDELKNCVHDLWLVLFFSYR